MIQLIFGSGFWALWGWVSVGCIILLGIVTLVSPPERGARIATRWFYPAAHVQLLLFAWTNGIDGVIGAFGGFGIPTLEILTWDFGQTFFSLIIEALLLLCLVVAVAARTKTRPRVDRWSLVALAVIAIDLALVMGGLLLLFGSG